MGAKRFYKFRSVSKLDDLANDCALHTLFNSYAIFHGRKGFDDLFDSKIDIVHPTPQEILELLQKPNIIDRKRKEMNRWISDGGFTPDGDQFLRDYEKELNNLIDSYPIYCLSSHNACNLLWSHYASGHEGFCIEHEFAGDQPTEVSYQEHIGSVALMDLIRHNLSLDSDAGHLPASSADHLNDSNNLGKRIMDALLVKLKCWSYEGEYRWIGSNQMGRVPNEPGYIKVPYRPQQVKAVIFGRRMPARVKNYIRANLPFDTEYKQAVERKDYIEIVPFDEQMHLDET